MTAAPKGCWLITSGAYVGQELAAEFGRLPPCFLPVGVKRLYEYQLDLLGDAWPLYMTLPETYAVPEHDRARLAARGVTILPVPAELRLGESVVFALNLISQPDQEVRILHGDTLVEGLEAIDADCLGIAGGREDYAWAEVHLDASGRYVSGLTTLVAGVPDERRDPVACGVFSFASSATLVRSLTRARSDFIAGLLAYNAARPLRAAPVAAWYDFGHLATFFRSRRLLVTARSFNTLQIDRLVARKSSEDVAKMRAEVDWFAGVPPRLRPYCARLIDSGEADGRGYYETEYEYLPTLAELFVFGTLGRPSWMQVMQSCRSFLQACADSVGPGSGDAMLRALAANKTTARLRQFADASGFDVEAPLSYEGRPMPALMRIAESLDSLIDLGTGRPATVMHGDLCFSNMLYDSRVQRIRVIDPRGYVTPGETSLYGDIRYDMAKLSHSIIGRYDHIISGRYAMPAQDGPRFALSFEPAPHHAWLEQALRETVIGGVAADSRDVRALTIGLFLSMLPLHADRPDRQRAFIANALRLHALMEAAPA
ncbi:phosphotransferase family enzyme [Humitalea rosea]|uniref:Phosphotransferase family enzyme n=1 Tax=Humitalea rosea TaxID=990373 RepID=A0A2W7IVH6_9PROT|nr:phosphotransferase [Humitalea rosea]PZW50513.1 phosphotransferase family enzyme [Humitalea rosea]